MAKSKREPQDDIIEETVVEETVVVEEVKINVEAFMSLKSLVWTAKPRLLSYVEENKLSKENTIKEWEKILAKC